jgi:hypothetical protein
LQSNSESGQAWECFSNVVILFFFAFALIGIE